MRATCGVMSARTPEQASGQRVDDLERLQLEVAPGAGQQRIEVLDQRRLHEPVAARAEVVEQQAPQRLDPLGFGRQDVLDVFGKDPLTHGERARAGKTEDDRDQADEAELPIGEVTSLRSSRARRAAQRGAAALDDQHQRERRPQRIRHASPLGATQMAAYLAAAFAPAPPGFLK